MFTHPVQVEIRVAQVCLCDFGPHGVELHIVLHGEGDPGEDGMPRFGGQPAGRAHESLCDGDILRTWNASA